MDFSESQHLQTYQSPLSLRYASQEMLKLFSAQTKYTTWRDLWIALAESQAELGLSIEKTQIDELKKRRDIFNWQAIESYEEKFQHDVMAHIHAFGDLCPQARGIIHLGATSCFVTDNGDLVQMQQGLKILRGKLTHFLQIATTLAETYADTACLGYTHFQPAQLTTVGKRFCLWMQDFLNDLKELCYHLKNIKFLGVKGATGTQASFLALFDNDFDKVTRLEKLVADKMGFKNILTISGQTYPRKFDSSILHVLSGIGVSAHKCATDLRLLSHTREVSEGITSHQVGSSAMPYKRNPILCERICSLGRLLISLAENADYTAATQWLERSLDDSANRRITIAEAFLIADAILELLIKVFTHLQVNGQVIKRLVDRELPFMCTENILMECVKNGKDRQAIHEKLRQKAFQTAEKMQISNLTNNLLEDILADSEFGINLDQMEKIKNIDNFVGCAPQQTRGFINELVDYLKTSQLI